MNKINISGIVNSAKKIGVKYAPEILTGLGITGFFISIVTAVAITTKAETLIREAEEVKGAELTKAEVAKTTWKCYIPVAVTTIVSTGCIIFASKENHRRNAALAAAYSISEAALTEYKDKVIETFGEKQEQVVQDAIAKDVICKNPVKQDKIIITGDGDTLCYDPIGGRYFRSDMDIIKTAVININFQMLNDVTVTLNDFYDEVHLRENNAGDILGWNINNGSVELRPSAQISNDGEPCIVVKFNIAPSYEYDKY